MQLEAEYEQNRDQSFKTSYKLSSTRKICSQETNTTDRHFTAGLPDRHRANITQKIKRKWVTDYIKSTTKTPTECHAP